MKTKLFSLILTAFLLSLAIVSANVSFSLNPTTLTLSPGSNSTILTITNTGNETATFTIPTMIIEDITINVNKSSFSLENGSSETILFSASSSSISNLDLGTYSNSFAITALNSTTGNNTNQSLKVELKAPFFTGENKGDLQISRLELNVIEGYGEDDEFWYPLDEVEISFEVENKGDWDIKDIEPEICLYDETDNNCVLDEGDMDLSEDNFDIDNDDDEVKVTATFKIDPEDLSVGNTKYIVYVRAIGAIDDSDSSNDGEDTGISISKNIEIRTDEKFVIADNIVLNPESSPCGREVILTADIWNLGDEDLDDDEVYVEIYNKDLGIDEVITFSKGIDSLDKEELRFTFEVPSSLQEKIYGIELNIYEDEDRDEDDLYQNEEEDESKYTAVLTVSGNCEGSSMQDASIDAELSEKTPSAVIGKETIILAEVTNTGDTNTQYSVSVLGTSSWAEVKATDPETFTLEPGESQEVEIFLNLDADLEAGEQKEFTIRVVYGNQTKEQKVLLTLEKGFNLGSFGGRLKENWLIYLIILINIILILAIVIIISRMVSKRNKAIYS